MSLSITSTSHEVVVAASRQLAARLLRLVQPSLALRMRRLGRVAGRLVERDPVAIPEGPRTDHTGGIRTILEIDRIGGVAVPLQQTPAVADVRVVGGIRRGPG